MPSALTVACAGLLLLGSWGGRPLLGGVLLLVQLALVAGWFRWALLRTLGEAAGAGVAVAAAALADIALLNERDDASVRPLAGVLAGLVLAAFAVQLARRDGRAKLTSALAATVASGALGVGLASLLGVRGGPAGAPVVAAALVAVAASTIPLQVGAWFASTERLAGLARLALPVALACAAGAAALVGLASGALSAGDATVVGTVAAVPAIAARRLLAVAEPVVDVGPVATAGPADDVRPSLSWPLAAALPLAVAAPVALVLARIVVG